MIKQTTYPELGEATEVRRDQLQGRVEGQDKLMNGPWSTTLMLQTFAPQTTSSFVSEQTFSKFSESVCCNCQNKA